MDWPELLSELNAATFLSRSSTTVDRWARLERARQLIEERYAESLDVAQLARAACLSAPHFARLFHNEYGETPHQMITRRRLHEAKRLLARDNLPVTAVTLEVGFASVGSFSTLFSRHVGMTPSRYQRRFWQVPDTITSASRSACVPLCFQLAFG